MVLQALIHTHTRISLCLISHHAEFSSSSVISEDSDQLQPLKVPAKYPLLARDLNDFARLFSVEDARVMVDLLKLAVAKRVGDRGKETLAAVLTTMARTNKEV